MLAVLCSLSLVVGLIASFAPVFIFNNFSEYKKIIRTIIQLLVNEDYTPREIFNILRFNDVEICEVEVIQKIQVL